MCLNYPQQLIRRVWKAIKYNGTLAHADINVPGISLKLVVNFLVIIVWPVNMERKKRRDGI